MWGYCTGVCTCSYQVIEDMECMRVHVYEVSVCVCVCVYMCTGHLVFLFYEVSVLCVLLFLFVSANLLRPSLLKQKFLCCFECSSLIVLD